MPETKTLEREYVIPLRRAWLRVPSYRRAGKAIKTLKQFIAKHMKVPERDTSKVKLDVYLNNELWFRGRAKPPAKVRVKAIKEGEIVHVTFTEIPQYIQFLKKKQEKHHKTPDISQPKVTELPAQQPEQKAEKTEEQKKDEQEKERAVAEQRLKEVEQQAKAQKHITKLKQPKIQRMALKK